MWFVGVDSVQKSDAGFHSQPNCQCGMVCGIYIFRLKVGGYILSFVINDLCIFHSKKIISVEWCVGFIPL